MKVFKINKRGIMGIGTLIIFIATILVSAVAAAVLISTSNVLQQRSLLVGQEARKSITDGVDIFSIMAHSNFADESFNNYEVMMRLSPGSDPLQMRRFDVEFLSNKLHGAAQLYYTEGQNDFTPAANIPEGTQISIGIDLDLDGTTDLITYDNTSTVDAIYINITGEGMSDPIYLNQNVSDGAKLTVEETAITINESYFGTIEIDGTASGNEITPASVTVHNVSTTCEFDLLPPEKYFCYQVLVGNNDYVLDSKEKIKLLYKTTLENEVGVSEDLMFIFASEKGRLTESRARAPDVVTYKSTRIWPIN